MNNNMTPKRIAAWIGIILLLGLYVFLAVAAFTTDASGGSLFMTALSATVAVPILLWLLLWGYGAVTGRHTIASLDAMSANKEHDMQGNVIKKEPEGQIKTIIFDIGDVLIDFCWQDFYRSRGYDEAMVTRLGEATVCSPVWKEFDRGVMTNTEVIDAFVQNDPEIETQIRDALRDKVGMLRQRPTTLPWIHGLQDAGYQVLVLSNFSDDAIADNKEVMAFLNDVDGGIISSRDKLIKPDPAIYKLLLDRYELDPATCVFIDDMQANIDEAIRQGIHGIHFVTREQVVNDLHDLGVQW